MPFGSKVPECDFCTPLDYTAAGNTMMFTYCSYLLEKVWIIPHYMISDQWGRLENASGLTASNVAKYDGLHSMVVFKEHPPSLMDKVSGSLFTYLSSS